MVKYRNTWWKLYRLYKLNAKETSSGNLNLRAEEGENYNLGLVWNVYNTSKTAIDMTLDFVELDIRDTVSEVSSSGALIDEMICKVQESGDTVQGYSYSDAYCSSVYALITRGGAWTPQGASGSPDVIPPEGGLVNVNYGYINQSGRYYRGADLARLRYLSDNYGDFCKSINRLC